MGDNVFMICFGIAIIIIAALLAIRYFRRNTEGKKEAEEFLKEFEHQMYDIMVDLISEFDITKYKTFEEYYKVVIDAVYKGCWEFIEKKIKDAEEKDLITIMAKKFLTKDNIEKFVSNIINKNEISEMITNAYGVATIEEISEEIVKEDKELQEEYSDEEKYFEEYNEDKDTDKLEEYELPKPTEEELAQLNPQKDEDEEVYSDDDTSVEEIKDYIIAKKISNGGTRYYHVDTATGKKKQVSKTFAAESNLEIRNE